VRARRPEGAFERSTEVWRAGERFGDVDVTTLGCLGRAQALLELGDRDAGLAMLDEDARAPTGAPR
jgi:hypothetical protein